MTPAQTRLVDSLRAGCVLIRSFDVYGGYWWWTSPKRSERHILKATVERLVRDGVLIEGENVRIYSGYHEMRYTLAAVS